jgi:hypothetical protein
MGTPSLRKHGIRCASGEKPCRDVRDKRTPNSLRVAKPSLRNIFLHTYRRNTRSVGRRCRIQFDVLSCYLPKLYQDAGRAPTDASSAQIV